MAAAIRARLTDASRGLALLNCSAAQRGTGPVKGNLSREGLRWRDLRCLESFARRQLMARWAHK